MAGTLAKVVQARRRPAEVGAQSIVGMTGTTRYGGQVFANGELWQARAVDGSELEPGEPVEVLGVDDSLTLEVRPIREPVGSP
jgi:membrane-bound ClpP family serine protease